VILLALDKNVSREALIAALFHDSNEIATGDAPSYAKDAYYHRWAAVVASEWESRNLPEVAIRAMLKLSQRELSLISLADALEALHFIEVQDDHSTVASNAHQFLKAKVARLSKELDLGDQLELPL
jgi:5'-deoxynucleotidase YfbR-like HD superfamily hydrolase